jgi:uncharacterized MnhB-related membrane protein
VEIVYGVLIVAMVACAIVAIWANRLVVSSLWLAALSALLAVVFYLLGAFRIAVIELSVGAGLVTVLLVFAIGVAGEEAIPMKPLIPRAILWAAGLAIVFLLGRFVMTLVPASPVASEPSLASMLWQERPLDALIQVVLIFCGVMGVLGLLTEGALQKAAPRKEASDAPPDDSASEPTTNHVEIRL